jgi:WD40 repeat protein
LVGALGPDRLAVDEDVRKSTLVVRKIVIRRATDGRPEHSIDRGDELLDQLLGSPDGTKLVARQGTALWAWSAADWKKPPTVVEGKYKNEMSGSGACFHPSQPYLLLANGGSSVFVFDTTTWMQVRKWKWDAGGVLRVVAVSPDGTLAAAGGTRGAIVVWDLDL